MPKRPPGIVNVESYGIDGRSPIEARRYVKAGWNVNPQPLVNDSHITSTLRHNQIGEPGPKRLLRHEPKG